MIKDIIRKIKNLKSQTLLFLAVIISVVMSCIISGMMSLYFNGFISHDYIITGIIASLIIASFVVYVILELTHEIKVGEKNLRRKKLELTYAKSEVDELKGLIPICSKCKKIRDDTGYWNLLESFIEKRSEALFSHSLCPGCSNELYGDEGWHIGSKCPVSGLIIKTDPEWTMGNSRTPYQVQFSILGECILYSCPSGFATSEITKQSVKLAKKIEDYIHKKNPTYVQIENFEKLSGFTINARLTYINHFKNRTGIKYLIFFGVSYLDSLSIKLASKLYKIDFKIQIVNSYQEAISLAKDLINHIDEEPQNKGTQASYRLGGFKNNQKKIIIKSDPSWKTETNDYRAKYEIINDNIIHCVAAGHFTLEQIDPMINIQKKLYNKVKHLTQGYHLVADVTKVKITNYKVRLAYIDAQNDFYNKYPFNSLSFYGASQIMKSAVRLGRPFLKFRMHMGNSLQEILPIIYEKKPRTINKNNSINIKTNELDSYVTDLLNYLGTLNPEIELPNPHKTEFPSKHPFRPVFEAIDLINNDLEQLVIERQNNEQYKLNMERKLSAAQKMEALGTLSGGIAHDFNNILSGIFGYSQLAQTHIKNPEKANKHIDQVLKGAKRAAELVQQILTLSRQTEYQKKSFRIYQEVNDALKLLRSTIPSTIEIIKKLDSRSMAIADPVKIHQVIMNLCTNAYHAMRKTGGCLTVSLTDVEFSDSKQLRNKKIIPGNYLELEVSDTGHGMDEKTIEKAFDPYYTTKEIGEGTGLGLAIVQAIVDEHDGYLEVLSTPGKGTNFYIYFPIIMEKFDTSDSKLKMPPSFKGNEKILVVDDEEPIRQIAKETLEKYGYKISLSNNGTEALKEFGKLPDQFDLIITDMNMPGMAGDKLSVELKKIRPDIPILICTGFSETMTAEKAASMGINGFLMKPVVMKDLAKKIREVFDKKNKHGKTS